MELYNVLILLSLVAILCLISKSTYDYHNKPQCALGKNNDNKNDKEHFVDDYYSFNWNSPTLVQDINLERVYMSGGGCSCFNKKRGGPRCTYSMSCDYTDDSSNPRCFAGYDRPGDGDLDVPSSFRIYDRNHSI